MQTHNNRPIRDRTIDTTANRSRSHSAGYVQPCRRQDPNYCCNCLYHERGNDFSKDMCHEVDKPCSAARLGTKKGNQIPIMKCKKFTAKAALAAAGWE